MLSSPNSVNKSYSESSLLLLPSRRCPGCKQHFEQLNYRQRFCQDERCRKDRRLVIQRAYDLRRRGKEVSA